MDILDKATPNKRAADFLKDKPAVTRAVFDGLLPELQARAFTVSGIESHNMLEKLRNRIADIPQGADWEEVKKDVAGQISPYLGEDEDAERRAETLLRWHGNQAYAAAQYEVMDRQRDVFPFWQYASSDDARVRPGHAALDGIVLPADSPFWADHFPPWEWGCRCRVIPLSDADVDELREADAGRPIEEKRVLEGEALQRLETMGSLNRALPGRGGLAQPFDVRSPKSKGAPGPSWNPGELKMDVEQLRSRYSPETFGAFETWAKQTKLSGARKTVWQWLEPVKRAPKVTARVNPLEPDAAASAIAERLMPVRKLGGSTGAMLMEDPVEKRRYVLKTGVSAEHIREEQAADVLYRTAGLKVPEGRLAMRGGQMVKLTEFVEGETLGSYLAKATPDQAKAVKEQLQKGFATDALLGNYDVIGMDADNVLIDKNGVAWRIDNGGSLRFRARGGAKTDWSAYPKELWSMRDPALNPRAAEVFGDMDFFDLADQAGALAGKTDAILAAAPVELRPMLGARILQMGEIAEKTKRFQADTWKSTYVDGHMQATMELRSAKVTETMAAKFTNRAGGVTVTDENGKDFDDLRGPGSKVAKLADAMKAAGTDYSIVSRWMGAQAGSSWSNEAIGVKYFWMQQRGLKFEDYYWKNLSESQVQAMLQKAYKAVGGEERFRKAWQYQHAFTQEILAKTAFRYNDRSAKTVRILRTEGVDVVGRAKAATQQELKRGAHESGSVFRAVYAMGDRTNLRVTVQTIPHERITATYMQERTPGSKSAAFLGDSENEFVFIPQNTRSTILPLGDEPDYDEKIKE